MSHEASVRAELEGLRELAESTRPESLRDGSWLLVFLAGTVDAVRPLTRAALAEQHPHAISDDALATERIARAQRRAALAGGLSAGTYASVVMATLATGGLVGVALPVAVAAFAVDLYYLARLQLHLAWELALVYRYPLDAEDPDDLWTWTQVAFGTDVQHDLAQMGSPTVPLASRFGTRALTTVARLGTGVQAVGRTVALRSLGKFAIPALGVPLCAGVNHWTTGAVGEAARTLFRDRSRGADLGRTLDIGCELTVAAVLLVLRADQRLVGAEAALLDVLDERGVREAATRRLRRDTDQLCEALRTVPPATQRAVLQAAAAAAALDGVVDDDEQAILDRLTRAIADSP